jgi:uncharacterized protein (TIGR02284 family)
MKNYLLLTAALLPLVACATQEHAPRAEHVARAERASRPAPAPAPAPLTADQKSEGVSKLNDLTGMLLDSNKVYADAAKLAKDPAYKAELTKLSNERGDQAKNFQAQVSDLGGTPNTSGGPGGAWQSTLMNLASLGENDTKAAVGQVLKAENGLIDKINEDLSDTKLADSTKDFLRGARDRIAEGRDRVADLKTKIDAQTSRDG